MKTDTKPFVATDQLRQQFQDEGYIVIERALSDAQLELCREHCQGAMDRLDAEMDAQGVDKVGINHRNKRYFAANCYQNEPELGQFIFSELMAEICKATIGDTTFLFWDQYVVKGSDPNTKFSWHQDSGYVHHECPPYVTCWIPLDDVTIENGAVYLLPYSRLGIKTLVKHVKDPELNDMVGYFGSDPGVPITVPAGSIAAFSSYVFHRSGPNMTDQLRRVFLPQYSTTPILGQDGKTPWGQKVPFLKDGEIVWKP